MPKPRRKPESEIQSEILLALSDAFHELGGTFWRQNAGTAKSLDGRRTIKLAPKGASDIVGTFMGRMVAPEIKRPRKKPTEEQLTFRDRMIAGGAAPFVWTSAEQAIDEMIRSFGLEDQRDEILARSVGPQSPLARARERLERRRAKRSTASKRKPSTVSGQL